MRADASLSVDPEALLDPNLSPEVKDAAVNIMKELAANLLYSLTPDTQEDAKDKKKNDKEKKKG